jgi:hypothetical protein
MALYRDKYKGHSIDFWEKSFSVDGGPVFMFGSSGQNDVYRMIDAIEAETKKQIRLMLGAV